MHQKRIDIEDLLLDESFINYCHQSSAPDIAYWETYIQTYPDDAVLLLNAKEQIQQVFKALSAIDLEEQAQRLSDSISKTSPAPVIKMEQAPGGGLQSRRFFNRRLAGIAAAVAIVLLSGYLLLSYFGAFSAGTYNAACGEKKQVKLPDGTMVDLNGGSKIQLCEGYGGTTRELILEGEAFFDVQHDPTKPFIVHTKMMDVKALGTAFNVKAYAHDQHSEAALIRGLVEVTLKEEGNKTVLLHPHEKVTIGASNHQLLNEEEETNANASGHPLKHGAVKQNMIPYSNGMVKEIAWKSEALVFEDAPLSEIAIMLERWYAVEIHLQDNVVSNYRFTGMFEQEELTTVLEFLQESKYFNYTVTKNGEKLIVNIAK